MCAFEAALATNDRLRALDCETFHAEPAATLQRCAAHLGVDMPDAAARDITVSDLFSSHAKAPGQRYDDDHRRAELRRLSAEYAGEIGAATERLEKLWPRALPGAFERSL